MNLAVRLPTLVRRTLYTVLIWSGVSLLVAAFTFISVLSGLYYLPPLKVLAFEFVCIVPWMIATPLLVWAAGKYPLNKSWNLKIVSIHVLIAGLVFTAHAIGQSATVSWFFGEKLSWDYIIFDFLRFLDMRIILYGGFMLSFYTVEYYRKDQEHRLREPQLSAEIGKMRYLAL